MLDGRKLNDVCFLLCQIRYLNISPLIVLLFKRRCPNSSSTVWLGLSLFWLTSWRSKSVILEYMQSSGDELRQKYACFYLFIYSAVLWHAELFEEWSWERETYTLSVRVCLILVLLFTVGMSAMPSTRDWTSGISYALFARDWIHRPAVIESASKLRIFTWVQSSVLSTVNHVGDNMKHVWGRVFKFQNDKK